MALQSGLCEPVPKYGTSNLIPGILESATTPLRQQLQRLSKKGWVGSTTLIADITRSSMGFSGVFGDPVIADAIPDRL